MHSRVAIATPPVYRVRVVPLLQWVEMLAVLVVVVQQLLPPLEMAPAEVTTFGGGTLGGAWFVLRAASRVGYQCVGSRAVEYLNRDDVGFELVVGLSWEVSLEVSPIAVLNIFLNVFSASIVLLGNGETTLLLLISRRASVRSAAAMAS